MFKALDKVRYDSLNLNQVGNHVRRPKVPSLVDLSCCAVNQNLALLEESKDLIPEDSDLDLIPVHLVPTLLQNAIAHVQSRAIAVIIANWPLPTLAFAEILKGVDQMDIFDEEMGCDFWVFRGIISRTKKCKMSCLDFRGLKLNPIFSKMMIQMLPWLSLRKNKIKPKNLAKMIAKASGVSPLREEILHTILGHCLESLTNEIVNTISVSKIHFGRGERMEVKLDSLEFTTSSTLFFDYLICRGIRGISPIHVTVSNIYIKSELTEGNMRDSLMPYLILKGQDTETLQGLSLRLLEEGIFFAISKDIQKCSQLTSLDIQDCNIYLQEGITRSRTLGRRRITETFQCLQHLQRLDISFNYLIGCLGEILDAIPCPLEYLSVRGCDLNEGDLVRLAESKHAGHLRELNLSKLCQFSIFESDRISPAFLLKSVKHFPKVTILNLSQNHLPDSAISDFSEILGCYRCLKGLDITGNILTFENQMTITRSCAKIPTMQWLRLTCANNMVDDALLPLHENNVADMSAKFKDLLRSVGRTDILVDVVRLSFTILVGLVDIFLD